MKKKCFLCDKKQKDIKKCSRCHNALYCSKECQVSDWDRHKEECVEIDENNKKYLQCNEIDGKFVLLIRNKKSKKSKNMDLKIERILNKKIKVVNSNILNNIGYKFYLKKGRGYLLLCFGGLDNFFDFDFKEMRSKKEEKYIFSYETPDVTNTTYINNNKVIKEYNPEIEVVLIPTIIKGKNDIFQKCYLIKKEK